MARKYIRNQQEKQCFQKQTLPARAIGRSRFGHFSLCIFIFRAAHSVSLVHEDDEDEWDDEDGEDDEDDDEIRQSADCTIFLFESQSPG